VEELLFSVLNFHNASDVRQLEIHTAEPLVPGPSHLEVEIAIAKLKKYKYQDNDLISHDCQQFKKHSQK
jgi:hypothetical protein